MSRKLLAAALLALSTAALALGGRALLDDPDRTALRKGQELLASGSYAEAVRVLEAISGDPAESAVVLQARLAVCRALCLRARSERAPKEQATAAAERARELFEALPADHPARGRARFLLADACELLGAQDEATRVYADRAAEVLSEPHRARVAGYYLALAERAEKGERTEDPTKPDLPPDHAAAVRFYEAALQVMTQGEPLASVTLPLCRNLLELKRGRDAAGHLEKLMKGERKRKKLSPAVVAEARFLWARALMQVKDPAGARAQLTRLLALPDVEETRFGAEGLLLLGRSYAPGTTGAENLRAGIAAWKRFLERHPDHAEAPAVRQAVATAWFDGGESGLALEAWRVVASDEHAKKEARALARFRMGECERRRQRFDAARTAFRAYLARDPDDSRVPEAQKILPELLLEKAAVLRAAERPDDAIATLRQYIEQYPLAGKAASVAVEIGLILRGEKRFADAVIALRGARERYRAADPEQAARAGLLLGSVEEEDLKDLEKAAAAFRDVVETFGRTQTANQARARLAEMEEIEISLVVPHMYAPGDPARAKLVVRNVPKIDFRIYRIDARESFERLGSLSAAADIEVALVKADRLFSYAVPDYHRYRKDRLEVPIVLNEVGEALPAGAYLVAAEAEQRRAVVLVLVSPFRVVVKQSPTEVFCWATDRESGEPQKGVEILVRDEGYTVSATTDADGVARVVHERERGKCRVLGILGEAVAPGLAPEASERGAGGLAPRVSFLLDRPIYRPGSEVAFRAVLRAAERGSFVTPKTQKVPVRLRDPQGRVVAEIETSTDRFGTVHGKLPIPSEGPLGDHQLEIGFEKLSFSEVVPVQAYKKPEYLVDVSTKQRVVRPGEEIDVTFAVGYFFGGAVVRAPFEWRVWRAPHAIDRQRYLSHAWYLKAIHGERKVRPGRGFRFVAQGGGTTDAEGRGTFPFRTVLDATASRYLVQVMVRDTSGEWVAGSGLAWAGPVGRFAVVLPDRRTYRTGDQAEIRVVTADLGHQPTQTAGEVAALLRRRDATGAISWDPVSTAAVDTGLAGQATVRLELPEPGTYRLQFSGDDGRGGAVVAHAEVVVTGKERDLAKEARLRFEHAVYRGGETARMHLSLPRAKKPVLLSFEGERVLGYRILRPAAPSQVHEIVIDEALAPNVTVAVAAPDGERLLTAEDRIVVLRYLEVALEPATAEAAPQDAVKLRVRTRDQAGKPVAASVAVRAFDGALSDLGGNPGEDPRYVFNRDVRPHLVRTGSSFAFHFDGRTALLDPDLVQLQQEVERLKEMAKLQVGAVILDRMELEEEMDEAPSESMNEAIGLGGGAGGAYGGRRGGKRTLRASGGGGRAAPKPMASKKNKAADPSLDARWKSVDKMRSEGRDLFLGDAPALGVFFAADLPMVEPTLRERFLDVAGWWPDVVTDAAGRAEVTLELPDNLTTWELSASGASRGNSVGRTGARVRTSKEVIARLERPRFLGSRDTVTLPATVHSNLEQSASFRLGVRSLDPGRLEGRGMGELSFALEGGDSTRRDFGFEARATGVARLEARALSSRGSDALQVGLPITAFGEPFISVREAPLTDRCDFPAKLPGPIVPGSARCQVVISGGVMGEVLDGLAFLAGYPYGCLEQNVNRWLPAMILTHALQSAGMPAPLDTVRLRSFVERGVSQLVAFQRDDGGFAYWPGGASHPWATALALEALGAAVERGYRVDARLIQSAAQGARHLMEKGRCTPGARVALGQALVAAGVRDAALLNALFRERAGLDASGLARLVIIAAASERPVLARSLFAALMQQREAGGEMPFRGSRREAWCKDDLQATALALRACQVTDADSATTTPLVTAVRKGMQARKGSTRGVALGLRALAGYVSGQGALRVAGRIAVQIDGEEVASGRLEPGRVPLVLDVPVAKLGGGDHRVTVTRDGGETTSCRLILRSVRACDAVESAGNLLDLHRRLIPYRNPDSKKPVFAPGYTIVNEESRPRPQEPPSLRQSVTGWKVTVELVVEAREDADYLVIEDPQLAGLEVIESGIRGDFDRYERRDSSLVFFKNALKRGTRLEISYPCYVVHAGSFHALPARGEEMYAPERWGRSASMDLEVVPDVARLARVAPPVPTPDERHAEGQDAFAAQRYEAAVTAWKPLLALDLRPELHDDLLAKLVRCHLRSEEWRDAVTAWDDLRLRNPAKAGLALPDRERLGRAFVALSDHLRAREQFQQVVLSGFDQERQVVDAYQQLGQRLRAVRHLEQAVLRYPPVGAVPTAELEVAGRYLQIPDTTLGARAALLPELRRVWWRHALDAYLHVMAWHPKTALAEEAGYQRVALYGGLGLLEKLVTECDTHLQRFPQSHRADAVSFLEASGLFNLDRLDEAAALARRVWSESWRRRDDSGRIRKQRSPYRFDAGFLAGKIHHVRGEYVDAVEWYEKVKEKVADARQSWLFFTMQELDIEPVIRLQPSADPEVSFRSKNLDEVRCALYPVDLSVLFAVKKRFDRLNSAELAGIRPAREKAVEVGGARYQRAETEVGLGDLEPGAYLLALRSGEHADTALVLVSACRLIIQRSEGAVRVYLTDGAGKPIPEARVKIGGGGRLLGSGMTDVRGLFEIEDPGARGLTVVAEKGRMVALGTHD